MNENLHRVVGIDLGTTYSAVALFDADEDTATIVPDRAFGPEADTTPSVVGFDPHEGRVVVGAEAKRAMSLPGRGRETIIEIKREMGVVFTEETLKRFGAGGTSFREGDPLRVRLHGEWLRPQEVSALVLMRMKEIAERELGGGVHDAVVTVPAYFTERQKKATEEAALLAGLHPRQLIPEPTAAAIAYGVDSAEDEPRVYLVFDLGGGTFDVSIIETRDRRITVLATAGDARLGGGDFDAAVADWLGERTGRTSPSADERMQALAAAEKAKRELSLRETTTIDLGDGTAPVELDRARFKSLIKPTLDRSLKKVVEALNMTKPGPAEPPVKVDAVLLVGGSTRIPLVREMLVEHFGEDDDFVRADGDPDTLVARGAALLARRFEPSESFDFDRRPAGLRESDEDEFDIRLITEHTLGVGVQDNKFDPLIERGAKIPNHKQKRYTNQKDSENVEVPIYQGEADLVFDNTRVGTIVLDKIEPREAGYHQFDITFKLDVNGLLEVKVFHANAGREYEATFRQSTSIGKIDMLAESRRRLLRLLQPRTEAEPSRPDPAAEPFTFTLPPPVEPVPDEAPAVEPDAVPAEFRRLFRKVTAWTSDHEAPEDLTAALREFTEAVRTGAELDDLADRLEDAYDRARR
ncbi:Hsp70 family protein [Amycolatopsis sp. SID8362]|uniref:Hsp70 family protein n=1 Tax=Amycolatopsis sp. SID8362 TaxID=2690346 RepID=UPI00136B3A6F|nr:Hsp70 family protein [Amycolatopsis sp. SID8362]NBH12107.1 Hsp70 family protein [Amycolatopsis sp. SID8362]NED48799.1 Hsp70 family protein [Amycolatopsis sp. SID8362]